MLQAMSGIFVQGLIQCLEVSFHYDYDQHDLLLDLDVHEDDHVVTYVCATYVRDELMT